MLQDTTVPGDLGFVATAGLKRSPVIQFVEVTGRALEPVIGHQRIRRTAHHQYLRHHVQEHGAHPWRQGVRGRRPGDRTRPSLLPTHLPPVVRDQPQAIGSPEMNVQHDHGHADRHGHQDHGEQQVLSEQRHGQGRGRYDLGQQQEEHGERHEYVTAQRHLGNIGGDGERQTPAVNIPY